jgi:hypothetical protein
MKKEAGVQLVCLIIFFAIITLYRRWFTDIHYLLFWLGGFLGLVLPILDSLVYFYFLRPEEPSSLSFKSLLAKRDFKGAISLLHYTREVRAMLIFHTATFQIFFIIFTFFIISSSGSLFGRGIVLAFLLHLFIDQFREFLAQDTINRWFQSINITLDRQQTTFYLLINFIILTFFGLLF